jgi:hypothetical protein
MNDANFVRCPGCAALLPKFADPTHRYIGASPSCWAIFADLNNAGVPPLAPAPLNALLGDAYAAQHPGTPSPQAIQSVAVPLLALYGVLERDIVPGNVQWIRQRALRGERAGRFQWLEPPDFAGSLSVAGIVQAPTPVVQAGLVQEYVTQVWSSWSETHLATVIRWYDGYVVADRL